MASLSTCHLGLWLGWQILLNLVKSDFSIFMRELPFLFMLEHGVEHGPEHTQDFSNSCSTVSTISCSRCFITSPEFEHSVKARLEHETMLN